MSAVAWAGAHRSSTLRRVHAPPRLTSRALLAPILLVALAAFAMPSAAAVLVPTDFEDTILVGGLNQPTDFARLTDGRVLVAEQKTGPYGAKGVGETGTFGVSPAIANAIHDAVGVRLTELPMNPEAVFNALTQR